MAHEKRVVMRLLRLEVLTSFKMPNGEVRELKDPGAPATPRQLRRLNDAGCLAVVEPGQATPISKGQAAFAVSVLPKAKPADVDEKAWSFGG